jgi:hypothetical protein
VLFRYPTYNSFLSPAVAPWPRYTVACTAIVFKKAE